MKAIVGLAAGVLSLAVLVAAAPAAAQSDAVESGVDASQVCSAHHKFGAQPVDVVKTPDGAIVLAQTAWNWHDSIGCFLTLDEGATAVLRQAPLPASLPSGKTADSLLCSEHHEFGLNPVDVAKTADGTAVLARLVWNWHDSIGCFLTLDAEAVETLQAAHAAANAPDPTPEPTPDPNDATPTVSGWEHFETENEDGPIWGYERFGTREGTPDSEQRFYLRCYADNTSFDFSIWSGTPVSRSGDDESVAVSIDLGGVSGEARWWAAVDDEYMQLYPSPWFVNEMLAAGPVTLGLGITDGAGRSQSLAFDMTGLAEAVNHMAQQCPVPLGWEHFETENEDGPIWGYERFGTREGAAGSEQWLYARCYADNTTFSLYISSNTPVKRSLDDESVTVTHRLGGSTGEARWWAADDDEWMAIYPPNWLVGELAAAGPVTLSLNVTDGAGRRQLIAFDMTGFAEAVDHMAQHCPVPGTGSDGGAITVPSQEPSGRCAHAVGAGTYQWEQCSWAQYWEDRVFNRPLSETEARTLITRIWTEVDVAGKPERPPTSELVPAGSECATATPGGGFIIGCYQPNRHHIRRLDAFLETLLHEVAHALVTNHPTVTACRGITVNDPYQACVHNDIFRCVANHLYVRYAGIPDAGVCGTSGSASQVNSWTAGENNWGYFAIVNADWHTRPSPYDKSDVQLRVRCDTDNTLNVLFFFADDKGRVTGNSNGWVQTSHVFLPDGYSEWDSNRQAEHIDSHRVDTNWSASTTHNAAFLPELFIQDFLNAAATNQSVLIRAQTRTDIDPVFMSFPLNGATTHIQSVTQKCGWVDGEPPADSACRPVGDADDPFNASSWCRVSGTNWYRDDTSDTDALTGSTTTKIVSYLVTRDTEYESPYDDKHTTLSARCTNNRFTVSVWFNRFIGTSHQVQISYRFDDTGSVRNENWLGSTNNEAAFSSDPRGFAQMLAGSSKLVLRGWDSGNRVIGTLTFRTTGANNEVNRVMSACGLA